MCMYIYIYACVLHLFVCHVFYPKENSRGAPGFSTGTNPTHDAEVAKQAAVLVPPVGNLPPL